jgi:(R,R)-butanediol dehydrogenase/meso-butanediol dehydrogenase/diacetyl reductase
MKALRLHGHRDVRVEDVEEPTPEPGWSIVEVGWASICQSDVKEYLGPLPSPAGRSSRSAGPRSARAT